MLICPNSGDECHKRIKPLPKTAFLIISYSGEKFREIENTIVKTLKEKDYQVILAKDIKQSRNLLCKICQTIRSTPIGIIVYTEDTPKRSLPNIFYELGLITAFGKEPILIKSKKAKIPSDLHGLEWIEFERLDELAENLSMTIDHLEEIANYYLDRAYICEEAGDTYNAVIFFERSYLLNPKKEILHELDKIREELKKEKEGDSTLSRRLIDEINNFLASVK